MTQPNTQLYAALEAWAAEVSDAPTPPPSSLSVNELYDWAWRLPFRSGAGNGYSPVNLGFGCLSFSGDGSIVHVYFDEATQAITETMIAANVALSDTPRRE